MAKHWARFAGNGWEWLGDFARLSGFALLTPTYMCVVGAALCAIPHAPFPNTTRRPMHVTAR